MLTPVRIPATRCGTQLRALSAFCVLWALCACQAHTWPGGIQARLVWSKADGVRVLNTVEDGPAAEAGLLTGDRLMAIDGVVVDGLSAAQIHELLEGEVGSWVDLTVDRDGSWQSIRVRRAPYRAGGP